MKLTEQYAQVVGGDVVDHLQQLAKPLQGLKVIHVNSTRMGGGVAEILNKLVPLMVELGLDVSWEVITGGPGFFECTKSMHNALQSNRVAIPNDLLEVYQSVNEENAERLRGKLEQADVVFIHDPQPAAMIRYCPNRRGKWIWRCHIDASHPYRPVWKFLRPFVLPFDASVFSLSAFAQHLPHPKYLITPSIDPLAEKNIELPVEQVNAVRADYGLDPDRPVITQISRFDSFKDPIGVIEAYKLAKSYLPQLQLVLAGGTASDDPEGATMLERVQQIAASDPDIKILSLPPDAHIIINALQRTSDVVLQKSLREGFGLTVTEAMWKSKPVIGGDVGGIRLQVMNYHTGFLVNTPEGAALRIRYLLHEEEKRLEMAAKARQLVMDNFLITRQLREYLTLMVSLLGNKKDRIELG